MKNKIEQLIEKGEYKQAIELSGSLNEFEKNYYKGVIAFPNSDSEWGIPYLLEAIKISDKFIEGREKKGLAMLHLALLYQIQGNFNLAQKTLDEFSKEGPKSELEHGLYLFSNGLHFMNQGNLEKANKKYFEAIELFDTLSELVYESFCYVYLALANDHNNVKIDYAEKGRSLVKKAGNKRRFAYCSCFKGHMYQTIGEYNKARELNQYCFDTSTELDFKLGIVNSTICLGKISMDEGNIKNAINQFESVTDNNFEFARVIEETFYKILGYRLIGELDKAHDLAVSSINKFRKLMKLSANVGKLYLQTILVSIELEKMEQARNLQKEFAEMVEGTEIPLLHLMVKLTKAIILKNNKNSRDKITAQDLFYELLSESDKLHLEIKSEATRNLCEILIQEYELYENKEVLDEAQRLIDELDKFAGDQNLLRIRFEIGILQSKIILLTGNIEKSRYYLEELLERAVNQDLGYFEKRIKLEISLIQRNFQKWMELVNNNQSLKTIIEESNLRNYFTMAKQYRDELKEEFF